MWKNYFGEGAKIYGVDINPECKKYEEEQLKSNLNVTITETETNEDESEDSD